MNVWAKAVSVPLGLAAFALFLVFESLKGRAKRPAWLLPTAVALAAIAIVGGLILQFAPASWKGETGTGNQETVRQETKGGQSPAINSHGNITVTYEEKPMDGSPKGGGK